MMNQDESKKELKTKRRSIFKQKKIIVAGLVVLCAISFLGYKGFQVSSIPQLTVSQFVAKGSAYFDKQVKIEGTVDSLQQDPKTLENKFTMSEGGQTVSVFYKGTVPDLFKNGSPALVTGKYNNGLFTASPDGVSTQCASKYVPATSTPSPNQ